MPGYGGNFEDSSFRTTQLSVSKNTDTPCRRHLPGRSMNQMLHPVPDRNHRGDSSRTMDGNDTFSLKEIEGEEKETAKPCASCVLSVTGICMAVMRSVWLTQLFMQKMQRKATRHWVETQGTENVWLFIPCLQLLHFLQRGGIFVTCN